MEFNDAQYGIMQRVGRLLYLKMQDELSEAQRLELEEWMVQQDLSTRQFLEEAIEWEQIEAALRVMFSVNIAAAFEDVQKKINLQSAVTMQTLPKASWIARYRWRVAAAGFLLLAGSGALYFLRTKKVATADMPVAQRYHNEVSPGGDKAILQLADGSRIVLDNASNGQLAQQGATRVLKQDDGQLTYSAGKGGAQEKGQNTGGSYNIVSTPKGGQYKVVLPDGSRVWLNAASTLRFPTAFAGNERAVELTGEGYFQVVPNAPMPFKVNVTQAGIRQDITVLGTEFNIMAYADEKDLRTTLIDGAVKVSAGGQDLALSPGQQARVNAANMSLTKNVDIEIVTAWKNGLFHFQDAPIEDIMRQVARWYDVEIVYQGKVSQQFFGTIPRNSNLTTLLKILESTGWVHFTIEGKKVTVMP